MRVEEIASGLPLPAWKDGSRAGARVTSERTIGSVPMLAGIPIAAELVYEFAHRVEEPAASTLRTALETNRSTIALTSRSVSRSFVGSRIARTTSPRSAESSCASTSGASA